MARALRAQAITRRGKNSVRNLRYGPQTRLVRGIYNSETIKLFYVLKINLVLRICIHDLMIVICYPPIYLLFVSHHPFQNDSLQNS